jgi:hypothetical protein
VCEPCKRLSSASTLLLIVINRRPEVIGITRAVLFGIG